jgi:iron-sulfur cluster assembly accessory protein
MLQPTDASNTRVPSSIDDSLYIELTTKAIERLKFIKLKSPDKSILKITIDPGGCSGFQYSLGLAQSANSADDVIFQTSDISIITDKESLEFLNGTIIDFEQAMMGSAFVMKNPKAKMSCGCGNSFTLF